MCWLQTFCYIRIKSLEQHFSLFLQQSTTYRNIQLRLLLEPNIECIVEILAFTYPHRFGRYLLETHFCHPLLECFQLRHILLYVCYHWLCNGELFCDYCVWSSIIDRFKNLQFSPTVNTTFLHFASCAIFFTLHSIDHMKTAHRHKPM